ncbi:HAD family hydrolase [Hyalangium versicolor]|uniref:HAD family hydrolase n=1 Tax=Hyalangium versicolor TaxID=2861190 RepID=UPI001CC964F3|nr:HAD family hydrolase [Hyalangium versicolor]
MYAFFDVDGTLLSLRSMISFHAFYCRQEYRPKGLGSLRTAGLVTRLGVAAQLGRDRLFLNQAFYRSFRGWTQASVRARAEEWFESIKRREGLWLTPVRRALEERKAQGYLPVFVSGSLDEILVPVARELGVADCLATRLVLQDGRYTGEIEGPQMIGQGKADALRTFLAEREALASECFAYGDHFTDVPMLEAVGHPVAVVGHARLAEHAHQRGWECLAT